MSNPEYYVSEIPLGDGSVSYFAWHFDQSCAYKIGLPDPKNNFASYFKSSSSSTVWDEIKKQTPWFERGTSVKFVKSRMTPGRFYRRMARPHLYYPRERLGHYPAESADNEIIAISATQLLTLTSTLQTICRSIHPHTDNYPTYGHEIRNFLILACAEVEAQWAGILKANGISGRLTTNEYVKLSEAMRLTEYEVCFPSFPWLPPIKPFENWKTGGKPTADIKWYDNYNAVKHDREGEFSRANLESAFQAMAACYVMLVAQFGSSFKGPYHPSDLMFFSLTHAPTWQLDEVYLFPDLYGGNDKLKNWSPADFPFP